MTKFKQIAVSPETDNDAFTLYALTEDGTLWDYALRDTGKKFTEDKKDENGRFIERAGGRICEMRWERVPLTGLDAQ